ncbi:hypothetical protein [Prescottella agglutinans]|uniref:hypothetical protein n=1 Tax=Prescottella agglutinans TaxID=1644129 RepID=UPI0013E2871E|nr:hypothetical protein [Prescottella agglutinans]
MRHQRHALTTSTYAWWGLASVIAQFRREPDISRLFPDGGRRLPPEYDSLGL